jgi:hypothetical protein
MSEKTSSKSKSWSIYYQNSFEYYESQQAALTALDSIVASYDSGIWSDRDSYLTLNYEQGVTVDNDLFDSSYSTNSLILSSKDRRFRVDIYIKNKEDWIFKHGSDLLQQSILAGYECNDGYLAERVARDYPGFKLNKLKYEKVDTPNEWCLDACLGYENAHCSFDYDYYPKSTSYYITIDNFLGKYQLIKQIYDPVKMAQETSMKIAALNALEQQSKEANTVAIALIGSTVVFCSGLAGLVYLLITHLSIQP